MNTINHGKVQVSYGPCPTEEFAGRFTERTKLIDIMRLAIPQGQTILISGARGSGKTSFLDWAEYEIQNKPGGLESPAIKIDFLEAPGMVFTSYNKLLTELMGHRKFGWFKKALGNSKVKKIYLLQRSDRDPTLKNVQEILPDAVDPARSIYSEF